MTWMVGRKAAAVIALIAVCLVWVFGCSSWDLEPEDPEVDDLITAEEPRTMPAVVSAPPQKLEVHLRPGDRFPLLKTVEQTLSQSTQEGWVVSRSQLEILFLITVREVHPSSMGGSAAAGSRSGEKRLDVRYQRIRYSQQFPGQEKVEYDSDAPPSPIPPAVVGYHGLKDNGFEFCLNQDNQVSDVVAFDQFVDRCLRDVPAVRHEQMRSSMTCSTCAQAVADFIDDSIGILPPSVVREGDSWTHERQFGQPLPMLCSTRYQLRRLTSDVAELEILGTTLPSIPKSDSGTRPDVQVVIRGGQSIGKCRLDRRTGLPWQSKVEQALDMTVRLADGSEFEQHKQTITTIKNLSESRGSPANTPGMPGEPLPDDVVHVSGENAAGEKAAVFEDQPLRRRTSGKAAGEAPSRR
ncbi:MAG: hypothetical protein JSS02_11025 [Planctomycetes bacterium]|nr:hypothetical protein [Planctomycetota bacterium]